MNQKYLICITGGFTAGKSSLAKMFANGAFQNEIHFIPHTTFRSPRQDDEPHLTNVISREEFDNSLFFTMDDNYGTLQRHVDEFISSNCQVGVTIVSCYEVPDISKKIQLENIKNIEFVNVLVRLGDSFEDEVSMIKNRLPLFYPESIAAKRIEWNIMFCEECFYNQAYLDAYVDIILSQRSGTLPEWCRQLESSLPVLKRLEESAVEQIAKQVATERLEQAV